MQIKKMISSCSKLNPHFCLCFLSEKCEVVFEQVLRAHGLLVEVYSLVWGLDFFS